MKTPLSLRRVLLLTFLVLFGPIALLGWVGLIAEGKDANLLVIGLAILATYYFWRTVKGTAFRPTDQTLQQAQLLRDKATALSSKVSNATEEWARNRANEVEESRRVAEQKKAYIQSVAQRSSSKPLEVVVLGGAGWESKKDGKFLLSMDQSLIYMSELAAMHDTPIEIGKLVEIDISGPGKVTSNAGVIGGGFGAEGAIKGIAVASVINLLTTYSNTKTFIRLGFVDSEIVMLTSQIEPDAARIWLSPLYLSINRKVQKVESRDIAGELHKLHELKQNGAITDQEFDRLKAKMIG